MTQFPVDQFKAQPTPFYYYDNRLLSDTIAAIKDAIPDPRFKVHYAVKANANPKVLKTISDAGFGADCVSGGEIKAALFSGFSAEQVVYAGVGKSDREIVLGLTAGIGCFNVESAEELEIINKLAGQHGKNAKVAIRVNPNIDAHTHEYITTGLAENKFGVPLEALDQVIDMAIASANVELVGLHFHIGSQLTELKPYAMLCDKVNELQDRYEAKGISFSSINVGGGLGIDYDDPDANPIPDFKSYFDLFAKNLKLRGAQRLHFELGRSVVAQCGTLITRVLYVKRGLTKRFAIVDAGFTDLIRPALYGAHHKIQNLSNPDGEIEKYDVVGPICESSDVFAKDEPLPVTGRGDLIALRSAGAYGEVMASCYNCRELPSSLFSND